MITTAYMNRRRATGRVLFLLVILAGLCPVNPAKAQAQTDGAKKYPGLLWEITGNGLKKPSYLFGTMHVSSKMVFHLSDAFYNALRSVDVVALELDPILWQRNMWRLDKIQDEYRRSYSPAEIQPINKYTFSIDKFNNLIAASLSAEPYVINGLLYRTSRYTEDFDEDTYLDLYIYQTGRKLGKICTGLEEYMQTERLIMEAYHDMYYDKNKKTGSGLSSYGNDEDPLREAYAKGDLDKLDSLNKKAVVSPAFEEKFLYRRNQIQANAIDSILHTGRSLFSGVGAAHLPGQRGVIELLRAKGYTLHPVKMKDRDSQQKDIVDKLRVPVEYKMMNLDDGLCSMLLPDVPYELSNDRVSYSRRQVAEMSNGVYFTVSRIPTYACLAGQSVLGVMHDIDSLLYENIPGKILWRKKIDRNGIPGFDIQNRSRRGDVSRYNIFVTPFEVIVFRMSGNGDFLLQGAEAQKFFASITFKERPRISPPVDDRNAGFSVQMPGQVSSALRDLPSGHGQKRLEYFSYDSLSGACYLLQKSDFFHTYYIEEDTFDLGLVHASLLESDLVAYSPGYTLGNYKGYPCIDARYRMNDSSTLHMRTVQRGKSYYTLFARSPAADFSPEKFFGSLRFTPSETTAAATYTDNIAGFTVGTPFLPEADTLITPALRALDRIRNARNGGSGSDSYTASDDDIVPPELDETYNGVRHTLQFQDPGRQDWVRVYYRKYGRYHSFKDSAQFWKRVSSEYQQMIISQQPTVTDSRGWTVYGLTAKDTNSARVIRARAMLKGSRYFFILSLGDTLSGFPAWVNGFYDSFRPLEENDTKTIFESKFRDFKTDFLSQDSVRRQIARSKLDDFRLYPADVAGYTAMLDGLSVSAEKKYYELKQQMIALLGSVDDSLNPGKIAGALHGLYLRTADTSGFQTSALRALARQSTKESFDVLKNLLVQDPPDLDDDDEIFRRASDSLKLAAGLFPDILQLTGIDDYKPKVLELLVQLADSHLIEPRAYESSLSKILFDARFALKKLQTSNEQESAKELKNKATGKTGDDRYGLRSYRRSYTSRYGRSGYNRASQGGFHDYAVLLLPFIDKNPAVGKFFQNLLAAKDPDTRLDAVGLLLGNKRPVPDSIIVGLAADPKTRGPLLMCLSGANRLDLLPSAFRDQQLLAQSLLIDASGIDWGGQDSIVFVRKAIVTLNHVKGAMYFFRLRVGKDENWRLGYAGLFPQNPDSLAISDYNCEVDRSGLDEQDMKGLDKKVDSLVRYLVIKSHQNGTYFYNAYNDDE